MLYYEIRLLINIGIKRSLHTKIQPILDGIFGEGKDHDEKLCAKLSQEKKQIDVNIYNSIYDEIHCLNK